MSTFREQRRADQAAQAEQRRADEAARAEQRRADEQARAERDRQAEKDRRNARRQAERDRQAEKDQARQRRQAARARAVSFMSAHVVELLIYPIALVSFALAAPAMASYGTEVYGPVLGWLLPGITELGMWCFALAVQVSRTRHPQRPIWALQVGVWSFGAVAFGLNALHGMQTHLSSGVVMGIVAVAGVIAHQLAVAAPARSRADRAEARIARQAERKRASVQRAAVRQATSRIDAAGRAELVYATGTYRLHRRRLQPVADPDSPGPGDAMDQALAALIDTETTGPSRDSEGEAGGGVATLDPPRPDTWPQGDGPAKTTGPGSRSGGRRSRSVEQLHAELDALLATDPEAVDTTSASAIAKALRCRKDTARALRDALHDHKGGPQ